MTTNRTVLAALLSIITTQGMAVVNSVPRAADYAALPPFLATSAGSSAPGEATFLIAASRDHRLFFKAYADFADITGDGIPDHRYLQNFSYYGYFDPDKCYNYDNADRLFVPVVFSPQDALGAYTRVCSASAGARWSGNFLNWVAMVRIDIVRKILYGGMRSTDSATDTVLQSAHLPADGHSFAKALIGDTAIAQATPRNGAGSNDNSGMVSFCRTTPSFDVLSHFDTGLPLLRWVRRDARLWSSNERLQCSWEHGVEVGRNRGTRESRGQRNDNIASLSGLGSHNYDPEIGRDAIRFNGSNLVASNTRDASYVIPNDIELVVRVRVCVAALINGDNNEGCKQYPDGNWKPIGVLQQYGEAGGTKFGLLTGSYSSNQRGGVLRKAISGLGSEINTGTDGTFKAFSTASPGHIVKSFDALRVFGRFFGRAPAPYTNTFRDMQDGNYRPDDCEFQAPDYDNGQCRSWGNPMAEILLESVNYIVGGTETAAYDPADAFLTQPGTNLVQPLLVGRSSAGALDELSHVPFSSTGYSNADLVPDDVVGACAPTNILVLNSGVVDWDADNISDTVYTGGRLRLTDVRGATNDIGRLEQINGNSWVTATTAADGYCAPRVVNRLADVRGLCPEAPTTEGSYYSAGLAYWAHINDLRTDVDGEQSINFLAVDLSPDVPAIRIPDPMDPSSFPVVILPIYSGERGSCSSCTGINAGQVMEFLVVTPHQEVAGNPGTYVGKYFISYEDGVAGGDFDQDLWGVLDYTYDPGAGTINVRTQLVAFSSAGGHLFGFSIVGTTQDGYHAYSGHDRQAQSGCPNYPRRRITAYRDPYNTIANPVAIPACDSPHDNDGDGVADDRDGNSVPDVLFCSASNDRLVSGGNSNFGTGRIYPTRCDIYNDPSSVNPDGLDRIAPFYYPEVSHTFTIDSGSPNRLLERPLWYAAKYGGFRDANNNDRPDLQSEWDTSDIFGESGADGIPDNYFPIENPSQLPDALVRVFEQGGAVQRSASGTAAAVVANERQGIGAVFQALFEPTFTDTDGNTVAWSGSLHALFIDAEGFLREDGNGNGKLEGYDRDKVVELRYNQSAAETEVLVYNSSDAGVFMQSGSSTVSLSQLDSLWNARDALYEVTEPVIQAVYGDPRITRRYIITWLDKDYDGTPDGAGNSPTDEVVSFSQTTATSYYGWFNVATAQEGMDIINYIRGQEDANSRNRTADYDGDGDTEVLLLGDIINSSPVSVAEPGENYDLLAGDADYAQYRRYWRNRRQVVYIGANDGMIHAFNAGFYDSLDKAFYLDSSGETRHPLGAELWAYVPKSLLPYLKWLKAPNYNHTYFVDGTPRIFDAKIFTPDAKHAGGWGTVLVMGMRLGGSSYLNDFPVDTGDDQLTSPVPDSTPEDNVTFVSSYVVMDITDPENPPVLLAELNVDDSYATGRPGVVQIVRPAAGGIAAENKWYLLLGSGPGDLDTAAAVAGGVTPSPVRGHVYAYDLGALVSGLGTAVPAPKTYALSGTQGAFVGSFTTSDFDLDLQAEVVYFGTVGDADADDGDLWRLTVAENGSTGSWGSPFKLLTMDRPLFARPTIALDEEGARWVFGGTGRFMAGPDNGSVATQRLFGYIDPNDISSTSATQSVAVSTLKDVTDSVSLTNGQVRDANDASLVGFAVFRERVKDKGGWRLDYSSDATNPSERSLNPSSLLGEVLFNTAFTPPGLSTGAANACGSADIGSSRLIGVDFRSGVPHTIGVFGQQACTLAVCSSVIQESLGSIDLGAGLASAPSLHLGQPNQNAPGRVTVVVQQSTGEIQQIEGQGVTPVSSGELNWREFFE